MASCADAALRTQDEALAELPRHLARRTLIQRLFLADGSLSADTLVDFGILEVHAVNRGPRIAGAPQPPSPPPPSRRLSAILAHEQRAASSISDSEAAHATAPAALAALRTALALQPDNARAYHALGNALLPRRGDYSRRKPLCELALAAFSQAASMAPNCSLLHMKAGTVAMRARLRSEAEVAQAFASAVEADSASRAASQHLITALQWAGDVKRAGAEVQRAQRDGFWPHAQQRPAKFTPGLTAKPFWNVQAVAPRLCTILRAASEDLAADLETLRSGESGGGCATQDEGLHASNTSWEVCDVLRRCERDDPRVRRTCVALLRWEAEHARLLLSAQFSLLGGGGHIRPHVGSTNRRIVVHYTLANDGVERGGAAIRVGTRWRRFVGGRCLAFDDSWEHEVVHPAREPRANLVLQIAHPELTL